TNHADVLKTAEGKHAFCNTLDYINAAYLSLQNSQKMFEKILNTAKNINDNLNEISFTPSLTFGELTKEQTKESQKFAADASKNPKSSPQLYEKNAKNKFDFIIPKEYPEVVFISYHYLKESRNMSLPFINEIISTDIIKNNFEKCPKLGLNFLLIFGFEVMKEEKFPYLWACAESPTNHLNDVCQKSPCIKKIPNLFYLSKQKFYCDKTLAMITDLLKKIDFHKELFYFQLVTHIEFIKKTIFHYYFDIKGTEDYLTSYNHIKNEIEKKADLLSILQSYYTIFYNQLGSFGQDARRRSPLIFGPLKNLGITTLSEPHTIFADFIKTDNMNELAVGSLIVTESNQAYKELVNEYNSEKDKNTSLKKKETRKKNTPVKKETSNKNIVVKNIMLSKKVNNAAPLSQKRLLKNEIKKYSLFYLSSYLEKCLESNDQYHTFPYIIDILTVLYGIPKKDAYDKNAKTYFWPIAFTDEENKNTEYSVYKIVQDQKDGHIFHRGPIKLTNVNLLMEFKNNRNVFDSILTNASLPQEDTVQNTPLENTAVHQVIIQSSDFGNDLEYTEIDNRSKINNPFEGLLGSKIVEITKHYITILALLDKKVIYFPLEI
ncbi:MAG TPA: hypothetical protein VL201_02675, partial [Patescibacteria group bacterium]|nr:hypothetical protein [Patescibacteria group bacterium]